MEVSQAAISLYEAGKRDIPLPVALRIATVLNLAGLDELLAEVAA